MAEIAKYAYLYAIGAELEKAYRAGGMECKEVSDLSDKLIAEIRKIDFVALSLIHAGARMSKMADFDKYDWICGVIEAHNRR
jgi:hypothetical protein